MKFLFTCWKNAKPRLLRGIQVVLSHEEKCHSFIESNEQLTCTEVLELSCDHEEADTRMITHARHASQHFPNILIKSPDTDVFVIALNASLDIDADIFMETGVGHGRRIISLSNVRQSLGDQWCRSLLGLHAFTGCDTTSSFYGKGKISALKIAKMKVAHATTFENLGREIVLSDALKQDLSRYVCHLYGYDECSDVNTARYQLFKRGKYEEELLPPNQDSLDQHALRANFQCYIWRHATQPMLHLPTFYNHGWKVDGEGNVEIAWMTIPAAPDSILEFVNCKCTKGCENRRCSCLKASLKCTDVCQCHDCKNRYSESHDESECYEDSDTFSSCDDHSSDEDSEDEQ
ncbi:uncharacterized protein LOC114534481 [Dendronephthya gigantea]|nr:uncharacterized protein LOC114534481 [Dendronephthya gigantea]